MTVSPHRAEEEEEALWLLASRRCGPCGLPYSTTAGDGAQETGDWRGGAEED